MRLWCHSIATSKGGISSESSLRSGRNSFSNQDQQQAVQTRERILAQVAREGDWVAAAHISFPGLGHVKAEGSGYRWLAANYTTELAH
ncbi:hypothetical protein Q5A_005855 [Serratia inhibens PRI-2C]|nr:hypothetical protein Q5A_005855 [Serratia inhibens PRI-2C]